MFRTNYYTMEATIFDGVSSMVKSGNSQSPRSADGLSTTVIALHDRPRTVTSLWNVAA